MCRPPVPAGLCHYLKICRWPAAVPPGADVQALGAGREPHQHGSLDHPARLGVPAADESAARGAEQRRYIWNHEIVSSNG